MKNTTDKDVILRAKPEESRSFAEFTLRCFAPLSMTSEGLRMTFVFIIHIYQKFISPFLGANCRFFPSCSEYASESIKHRGLFKGLIKIIARVLKCHPLHSGGYDPITFFNPPEGGIISERNSAPFKAGKV
jgi:putative membrane protein insertion efficiency factor